MLQEEAEDIIKNSILYKTNCNSIGRVQDKTNDKRVFIEKVPKVKVRYI